MSGTSDQGCEGVDWVADSGWAEIVGLCGKKKIFGGGGGTLGSEGVARVLIANERIISLLGLSFFQLITPAQPHPARICLCNGFLSSQ